MENVDTNDSPEIKSGEDSQPDAGHRKCHEGTGTVLTLLVLEKNNNRDFRKSNIKMS